MCASLTYESETVFQCVPVCVLACVETNETGYVVHACNPSSIQEAEAGGSPQVSGQSKYVSLSYSQHVSQRETKL